MMTYKLPNKELKIIILKNSVRYKRARRDNEAKSGKLYQ